MPDPLTHTPEAPPSGPVIPVGLSTRIMQIVGAAFALVAATSAVLDGDHSQITVLSMILSAVSFFVLAGGRYAQAALAQLAVFWGVNGVSDPTLDDLEPLDVAHERADLHDAPGA